MPNRPVTYDQAIQWIADHDVVDQKAAIDVDSVYRRMTAAMVSGLFGVDRRIVATDVVRKRVDSR
jgi:hypothetical protein